MQDWELVAKVLQPMRTVARRDGFPEPSWYPEAEEGVGLSPPAVSDLYFVAQRAGRLQVLEGRAVGVTGLTSVRILAVAAAAS